jgi:hypothetical protein
MMLAQQAMEGLAIDPRRTGRLRDVTAVTLQNVLDIGRFELAEPFFPGFLEARRGIEAGKRMAGCGRGLTDVVGKVMQRNRLTLRQSTRPFDDVL